MEYLPVFAGIVKSLFFTHNTLITVLYTIINSNDSHYIRCCARDGSIINKAAQFRHGLDSQYGDIVFVMRKDFWLKKKGMDYHHRVPVSHAVVGHSHKRDFIEYNSLVNINQTNKWLEKDARLYAMREPIRPDKAFGNGKECKGKSWQFSWCNAQLHLGENIALTNVRRVYAPAWLLRDKEAIQRIQSHGVNTTLLQHLVSNQLPYFPNAKHIRNPLNGLFHLYGPPLANDHYHIILKTSSKIGENDLANHTYYSIEPTSFGTTQHIPTHRAASHSTSTVYLDEKAFKDLEIRYMADLVHNNMTELPYVMARNISKAVLFHQSYTHDTLPADSNLIV